MILSAVSLFKKFNTETPLGASEWGIEEKHGVRTSHVSFSGHAVEDGSVRIYARFGKPISAGKKPAIVFLADAGRAVDEDVFEYFLNKGYAVLIPDYSGKMDEDKDGVLRTVYPESLKHGNYQNARGLYDMQGLEPEESTWFEWTYVALFAIKYLKSRDDISEVGVVGVRKGGDIAWHTLLSPQVKCGVPVNSVGWYHFSPYAKFGDNVAYNLSDDAHKYIASVEAQSYAPYIKKPVLMLCALHDYTFDCDRAYDTYSRLGLKEENALVYSSSSGACIGLNALTAMDLFLEKNLKD
jgi:dienelactone hydrolase